MGDKKLEPDALNSHPAPRLRNNRLLELQMPGELEVARTGTAGDAGDLAEGSRTGRPASAGTAEDDVVPCVGDADLKLEGQVLMDDESLAQTGINTIPGIWIAQPQRPRPRRISNQVLCSTGCGDVLRSLESGGIPVSFRDTA